MDRQPWLAKMTGKGPGLDFFPGKSAQKITNYVPLILIDRTMETVYEYYDN